jgi:hypothetical protein
MGWSLPVHISTGYGRDRRDVEIVAGNRYQVLPMNARKQKHRGRYCVVVRLGWESFEPSGPADYLVVRFEDTGRLGHVEWSDLIPA